MNYATCRRRLSGTLMAEDCFHPIRQGFHQFPTPFCVIEIWYVPKVPKVERYIFPILRDQDHFPSERMRYTRFIENVGISACAVTDNDA